MPTRHHYGYWISPDGSWGYGDLLFIDERDLTPSKERKLQQLLEAEDFSGAFELVRSKIK